jgi:hypothetical protein
MIKPSKKLAANIARTYPFKEFDEREIRDHVDLETGGELDCFQLDLLTDWVMAILR